jgi:preprotein translocase subunit SecF
VTPEELNAHIDSRIKENMQAIAELAAQKAIDKVYADIGASMVKKLIWGLGVLAVALLIYLAGRGAKIPLP